MLEGVRKKSGGTAYNQPGVPGASPDPRMCPGRGKVGLQRAPKKVREKIRLSGCWEQLQDEK